MASLIFNWKLVEACTTIFRTSQPKTNSFCFFSEVEYWMISDNLNNNVANKSSNFGGDLKPDT